MTFAGIDVGACRFHCVALDRSGHVVDVLLSCEARDVVEWCEGAKTVAIDSSPLP